MSPLLTTLLGAALGAGLLLVLAPLFWPAGRGGQPAGPTAGVTSGPRAAAARLLAQAGLRGVPPLALAALSVALGVIAAGLAQALLGITALAVVCGAAALLLPLVLVRWRAAARRSANREVWPDVVDHLVSAVRSGLSLPDSVSSLARVGPPSTRAPFADFERDYRSSANFVQSVERLKDALADPVADRILETLKMAREVGGTELTGVLRSLAGYLREDAAVRAELRARQGWVVNAARLGVAAPWIVLVLLASRPEAARAYDTPAGSVLILGGLLLSVVAYRVMLRLGRLPEEQRWFR
ncbi:type II secretion system F family protein [Microterricola pindariensis]|uniref:type II secretion system F family protein n=1 Tax=Microterricola pindariensis TaxID=478010 RepID=UPI001E3BA138|nr:type II secretion system F family protein [Microterricola pindariensis]